ncbi:hypothetical protein ARMSODRAFT_1018059 [Armillaria solidipes]|uniref:Uncharacterized protein n=1 Tax=Armillaria solidipes TaxID=1076256 RepID=A0A2H3BI17_9AGAR|nr:hypothetical protein ARMSODRAFT_1018059 [Armillaria solidipes]
MKNGDPDEPRKTSKYDCTKPATGSDNTTINKNKNEHGPDELYYCQPTSSKVLVEDLVTSKEDEQHFQEYHTEIDDEEDSSAQQPATTKRRFWDRPIVQDNTGWPGDHRMPGEWNWMMEDIWCYKNVSTTAETIGPIEFTRSRYPNMDDRQTIADELSIAPDWGTAESIWMAAMIDRNEGRNHRKPRKPEKDRKGKQRRTGYCEDDIPRLKQAWYDEYEELLQGVPETMPPFRIVNHEIPLVDPDKKYHYHLPRCPNSLKAEFNEKVEKYT